MKVTIEINCDQDWEFDQVKSMLSVDKVKSFLWEYDQKLRNIIKYSEDQDAVKSADFARDLFYEYMRIHGVEDFLNA
jgi:hypothetical protein